MLPSTWKTWIAVLLTSMLTDSVAARSPETANPRLALLELYTSEGCNSCPPADRWLSSLPRTRQVAERLVALAFHVDYWNDLGWPDRFAQRRFTERQQALRRANGLRTLFTPQLLLNGRDFRERGALEARIAALRSGPAAVRIRLDAQRYGAMLRITAEVEPLRLRDPDTMLYVAVYENNLVSAVTAGENRGHRLRHDYVVRTLLGPGAVAIGSLTRREEVISLPGDWKIGDLGVAAFVQHSRSAEVLQAAARPVE